jgi:hypothetical protein
MSAFHSKMTSFIVMSAVVILPNFSLAQSQTAPTQSDQPSRVSVVYVPPQNSAFQQLYDPLRERRALERIQEILSPFQVPEQLTIKTTECGAVKFLLPERKLQADRDDLLRAFEAHFGFCPKRNYPCRSNAGGCSRWTVFLRDFT